VRRSSDQENILNATSHRVQRSSVSLTRVVALDRRLILVRQKKIIEVKGVRFLVDT
jgi:hypothetical protein